MKYSFFVLFSLLIPTFLFAQGPISGFVPKDGQVDLAYSYSEEKFTTFLDENGDEISRNLTSIVNNFYLEYGFNSQSSLVLTAPHINNSIQNKGWQDGSIWLKYRNERTEKAKGFHNIITAIGLSFPMSNYANDNAQAIGRKATTFHGRIVYQYEAKYGWFLQMQSGIDFQFVPTPQAALPLLLKGGIGTELFYVDVWLEHFRSLNGNPSDLQLTAGTGSTWTRGGTTLFVPVLPWIGLVGNYTQIFGGKNIGLSKRWNLGVVLRNEF